MADIYTTDAAIDVSKYLRIPYVERGRGFSGCDCFGLVRLVLQEEFGQELPDILYKDPEAKENRYLIDPARASLEARRAREPRDGDIVLSFLIGVPHIGIVVGGGSRILHTTRALGVLCERRTLYRYRVEGVYRVLAD